jgi:hypothetical protein
MKTSWNIKIPLFKNVVKTDLQCKHIYTLQNEIRMYETIKLPKRFEVLYNFFPLKWSQANICFFNIALQTQNF